MHRVKDIINSANFSGKVFPFSKEYAAWETDEVRINHDSSRLRTILTFTLR